MPIFPYTKFVACCDASEILFKGTISGIVSGSKYRYIGTSPFPGSGGSLSLSRCYTVTVVNSETFVSFPDPPAPSLLNIAASCDDPKCIEDCDPIDCECPDGYTLIDGNCVISTQVAADYSGGLVTLNPGDNVSSYCKRGLRLYPDISSEVFPLLGDGSPYLVRANNGAGATITPLISSLQSTLWGCETPTACATFPPVGFPPPPPFAGRLNIVGVWNNAYNLAGGDGPELGFDFCVDIATTKQYLIGIAGDNKVKLYIDGVLTVFLDTDIAQFTNIPFNYWHVFPITLTAGLHTIRLAGINTANSQASFGGEIYDITLAQFQANLTDPAIGSGNCGNVVSDLTPYILFSTESMIGQLVPDPADLGVWSCPDGSILDECNGVPLCNIEDSFPLECPCYYLIPCDGITLPFVSSTLNLSNYIDQFVSVSTGDFTGCVYVSEIVGSTNCEGATEVTIDGDTPCDCPTICYYIEGAEGISYVQYIDGSDQLLQITSAATPPWLTLCSKIYPIVSNTTSSYTIIALGSCVDNECVDKCFLLTNCDPTAYPTQNATITSTLQSLLQYVNSNSVLVLAGYEGCWTVTQTEPCDCPLNVTVIENYISCDECIGTIAYKLTNCEDSSQVIYSTQDLSAYIGQVIKDDCGCWSVEQIDYQPPSQTTIATPLLFTNCTTCLTTYYQLDDCDSTSSVPIIITSTDLSGYIGSVIQINGCTGCYTVSLYIPETQPAAFQEVTVTLDFTDCSTCRSTTPKCSTVFNTATFDQTYTFINANGDSEDTDVVKSGHSSLRYCVQRWDNTISSEGIFNFYGDCNVFTDNETGDKAGFCVQYFPNDRKIKPGYNTPICSSQKYDKITCNFAEIAYKEALALRYGISNCCPELDEKWVISKELIELQALYDPKFKCLPITDCCGKTGSNCSCNS